MSISPGTRLGPYEVLSALGAGGMGEVYKARDTRLDRAVALKVIQTSVSASAEMRERFEREARAISALDHPHICMLYDVCRLRVDDASASQGRDNEISFLVMQYLEGETLADRLARAGKPASDPSSPSAGSDGEVTMAMISRGPIPFETALKYAAEIAQALDAAHRRGIVHRDLKPGNVMLTKTGTKLLDFGLAKLVSNEGASGIVGFDDGVTRSVPLTSHGAILGTLYYMSPEQLEGRDVDSRSDIHAFGALLFEMLSGTRAFAGQSQASIIAAIINSDPPKLTSLADSRTTLPVVAQRALDRLLAKCLAKNPDDRWQSAADLSAELQWIGEERRIAAAEMPAPAVAPVATRSLRTRERILIGMAAAALVALAGVSYFWYPRQAPTPEPVSFAIEAPEGKVLPNSVNYFAISPDGLSVAFITRRNTSEGANGTELWVRRLGSAAPVKIADVTDAVQLVWSPNSKSILYTEGGAGQGKPKGGSGIRRIDLAGGPPRTVSADVGGRATWGRSGVILAEGPDNKLYRVSEAGGKPVEVLAPDSSKGEQGLKWPSFLPDGRQFLFLVRATDPSIAGIYIGALDSSERTRLVDATSSVEYAAGYLFYQRDNRLMAHPFDAVAGRLKGDAIPAVENIRFNVNTGRVAFSVSESGTVVYVGDRPIADPDERRIMMVDRSGKDIREIGPPGPYSSVRASPDGRRAVLVQVARTTGTLSLHMIDLERNIFSPLTRGTEDEQSPLWTPDGASIVFRSSRSTAPGIYRRGAGGASTSDELLLTAPEPLTPTGFSSDGQRLLFTKGGGPNQRIWILPVAGSPETRKPAQVFPGSTLIQSQARLSPDDKWIVYSEGPRPAETNVYIQPYPPNGTREQISPAGGRSPFWTKDGRHILYRADGDSVMSVELRPAGNTFRPATPVELFNRPPTTPVNHLFDVDDRGERFLFVLPPDRPVPVTPAERVPMTVIVNFAANIGKK